MWVLFLQTPGKTNRNYPEYTELRIRGRMPLNILTWPRLTFLARRQTLVYPVLFIKHTLIINSPGHHLIHLRTRKYSPNRENGATASGPSGLTGVACSDVVKCRNDGTEA